MALGTWQPTRQQWIGLFWHHVRAIRAPWHYWLRATPQLARLAWIAFFGRRPTVTLTIGRSQP